MKNIETVIQKVESLTCQVREGFKGVYERQDKANGLILKNKEWIDQNDKAVQELPEIKKDILNLKLTIAKWAGVIIGLGALANYLLRRFMG